MRSEEKEQQRVKGFSTELAVVTYGGGLFGLAWCGSEPARRPSATIPAPRSRAILGEQARGRLWSTAPHRSCAVAARAH
jgi:hypothetical protein